jgi:RimJ/RimL family protein N-acetyltransferase
MEFRAPIFLSGRHVRLVPLELGHLAGLVAAAEDPEIWRFMRGGDFRGEERMRARIEEFLARQRAGTDLPFVVLDAASDRPIGATGFMHIERADRCAEIGGTWYARHRWRTAVNTESKLLLLRHAFEVEGCHRVELRTDERNVRSQRAIERLGAVREGVLREHVQLADGGYRTSVVYGMLAPEWPAARDRLAAALARGRPAVPPLS